MAPFDVVFTDFDVVEPDLIYMSHERAADILTPIRDGRGRPVPACPGYGIRPHAYNDSGARSPPPRRVPSRRERRRRWHVIPANHHALYKTIGIEVGIT